MTKDWDRPRDAYSGRDCGKETKAPRMLSSVNPPASVLPQKPLFIPMPPVCEPKAEPWLPPESRLEKALRLAPRAPVQQHWKAIKHTALAERTLPPAPPPPPDKLYYLHGEPEAQPWWWKGYMWLGTSALVIMIVLILYGLRPAAF